MPRVSLSRQEMHFTTIAVKENINHCERMMDICERSDSESSAAVRVDLAEEIALLQSALHKMGEAMAGEKDDGK